MSEWAAANKWKTFRKLQKGYSNGNPFLNPFRALKLYFWSNSKYTLIFNFIKIIK